MGFLNFLGLIFKPDVSLNSDLAKALTVIDIIIDQFIPQKLVAGEIQRILYLCHAAELIKTNGQTGLIGKLTFRATLMGPKCAIIEKHLRARNMHAITNLGIFEPAELNPDTVTNIKKVCSELRHAMRDYGTMSLGGMLVNMTQSENGAWAKNYHPGTGTEPIIQNNEIYNEYK